MDTIVGIGSKFTDDVQTGDFISVSSAQGAYAPVTQVYNDTSLAINESFIFSADGSVQTMTVSRPSFMVKDSTGNPLIAVYNPAVSPQFCKLAFGSGIINGLSTGNVGSGNVQVLDTFGVTGDANFGANLYLGSGGIHVGSATSSFNGPITFSGLPTFATSVSFSSLISMSGGFQAGTPVGLSYSSTHATLGVGSTIPGSSYFFEVQGTSDGQVSYQNQMALLGSTSFDDNRIDLRNSAGTSSWRILGLGGSVPTGTTYGDVLLTRSSTGRSFHIPSDLSSGLGTPTLTVSGSAVGVFNTLPGATFHSTGTTVIGGLSNSSMPVTMGNSQINFWINEVSNTLSFQAKYSTGVVKSGTVALS